MITIGKPYITDEGDHSYLKARVFVSDDTANEWIKFSADTEQTVSGIKLFNGYQKNATTYNTDNSQYNFDVNLNASGNLDYDAKSLAEEVIKQIVIKKQAGGK